MNFLTKKKHYIWYLREFRGHYQYHSKKRINLDKVSDMTLSNGILFNSSKDSFSKGNKVIYLIDKDNGQLDYEGEQLIKPKVLRSIMKMNIFTQIIAGLREKAFDYSGLFLKILLFGSGVLLGLFIAGYL